MAMDKGLEQLSAQIPKQLKDELQAHANQLNKNLTKVVVSALRHYMASPESRLAIVEAKLQEAERKLNSLISHAGQPRDYANKKPVEGLLAPLLELERRK